MFSFIIQVCADERRSELYYLDYMHCMIMFHKIWCSLISNIFFITYIRFSINSFAQAFKMYRVHIQTKLPTLSCVLLSSRHLYITDARSPLTVIPRSRPTQAVVGGPLYRGTAFPNLDGSLLFGDVFDRWATLRSLKALLHSTVIDKFWIPLRLC